ncbi:MAG: hypothetical protein ACJ72Q_09025 [Nitrososphaeraceae archaeon]
MEHLSSDMEQQKQQQVQWKKQSARALQQRIQPKRDISSAESRINYC